MLRNRLLIVPLLILSLVVAGCGASGAMKSYQTLAITAVTLDSTAEQMQVVNGLFVKKCADKTLGAKACNDFITFGTKFKTLYPATVSMWKASRNVSDVAVQGKTDEIVRSLITELVTFGTTVGYQVLIKN